MKRNSSRISLSALAAIGLFTVIFATALSSRCERLSAAEPPASPPGQALAPDGHPVAQPLDEPKTIHFVLHPCAPAISPLAARLLPRYLDKTPGNAAPIYLKALVLLNNRDSKVRQDFDNKVDKFLHTPIAELPTAEVEKQLQPFRDVLGLLKIAARRDHCDWDPPIREMNVYMILLPEFQDMRKLAYLLALDARLQIAQGHNTEAIETLSTGFAMARHTADCPFLISGLIGIAISGILQNELDDVVQMPNCPNLYWSITSLPDPFIDFHPAYDLERDNVYIIFPELRGVAAAEHSAAEWREMLASMMKRRNEMMRGFNFAPGGADIASYLLETTRVLAAFPLAKAGLIAAGRSAKDVEAMQPAQVILIYTAVLYEQANDEHLKWANIPYWQAREPLQKTNDAFKFRLVKEEAIPLAQLLTPATLAVQGAQARSGRRFAILRTVEALRGFADAHQGKFPDALTEITDVPLPLDPVTGKPFDYQRLGEGKVSLEGKPPAGEAWDRFGLRYELTWSAGKK